MRPLLAALLVLGLAAPAHAQDPQPSPTPTPTPTPPPEPRIAPGVTAAKVDVSNLTVAEAAAKLDLELGERMAEPVIVAIAGRRWTLRPRRAGLAWSAERTAQDALEAGEAAGGAPVDVPLRSRVDRRAIAAFTEKLDRKVKVRPRNARLRITIKRMIRSHSKTGRDLEQRKLAKSIRLALRDPWLARLLKPGRRVVEPRIDAFDLARRNPTIITIHRRTFTLRLFKRLQLSRRYGVAVGAVGYDTPTGLYRIQNKAVNPVWNAPNKPWAGLYAGRSIPGGSAENPLKARWLGIVNGVGIHGTAAEYSIGSRASHGCIRMRVADVIDLYGRVPVGTPVLIR